MAYLGNSPARSFISFERQVFTIVNSQTAYTLDHSVTNENDIRLVVNNVVQEPGSGKAYTASGTTLTLSAALTNGTDEMYCVYLGRATATEAPGAGSVGTSQLADDSVTNAKISYPLTESGATVSTFNRTTSDGNILELQKDGTVVGSIGNKAANIFMTNNSSNNTGFKINPNAITPSTSTGTDRDNAIDLGASGAAYKDLYLGGGLYVGGTAASNLLDDYEEGSFTTTLNSGLTASLNSFNYTKIGNFVILSGKLTVNTSDGSSTNVTMSLPFNSSDRNAVTVNFVSGQNTGDIGLAAYSNNSSNISFYKVNNNANESNHRNSDVSSGDEYYFTFTYRSA